MRRYWFDKKNIVDVEGGQLCHIKDRVFRHICLVCRQVVGDQFELLTAGGYAHKVEIIELKKKVALARVLSTRELPKLPRPHIELCVSIPKFSKLELIIEKSVELSVHSLRPFFSENSFVRSSSKVSEEKLERWQNIVVSATQQSGRGDLMKITPPVSLKELLAEYRQASNALGLFPYEGDCKQSLKSYLRSLPDKKVDSVWTFVGSEGGFSLGEVEGFKAEGLAPLTLGEQVLRVETACVSMASLLKYELIDT